MKVILPFLLRRLVPFVLASSTACASAGLIDYATYTRDTVTGLDWLDLTATRGFSYDDVASQMGSGQMYEGWRFASRAEVTQFWSDAGGTGPFTGGANGGTNWVGQLQALWGKTYPFVYVVNGYTVQGTIAMTSDSSQTCSTCNLTVYLLDNIDVNDSSLGDFAEAIQLNEAYRWQGQAPIGQALVRSGSSEVPEPNSMALVALAAILGFGWATQGRKRHCATAP